MTLGDGLGPIKNLGLFNYINLDDLIHLYSFNASFSPLSKHQFMPLQTFRYLIGEVSRDPKVPSLRRLSLPALMSLKDLLDRCQKSLDEFLEVRFDTRKIITYYQ